MQKTSIFLSLQIDFMRFFRPSSNNGRYLYRKLLLLIVYAKRETAQLDEQIEKNCCGGLPVKLLCSWGKQKPVKIRGRPTVNPTARQGYFNGLTFRDFLLII